MLLICKYGTHTHTVYLVHVGIDPMITISSISSVTGTLTDLVLRKGRFPGGDPVLLLNMFKCHGHLNLLLHLLLMVFS